MRRVAFRGFGDAQARGVVREGIRLQGPVTASSFDQQPRAATAEHIEGRRRDPDFQRERDDGKEDSQSTKRGEHRKWVANDVVERRSTVKRFVEYAERIARDRDASRSVAQKPGIATKPGA
jgi:hypothetical protein